jgi:hypothetical protein
MANWDELWGTTLDEVSIDLVQGSVTLEIRALDSGVTTLYKAVFQEVSQLRYFNSIPLPWSYVEITEAESGSGADGVVHTQFMLWSEDAGLGIESSSVNLVKVTG